MEELYEWINHSRHPYDIDEFVSAVTKIEHGFANLNSEAQYLLRNKDRLTPQEVLKFNEHLEEILKLAIKKEIILEFLLDEIKTCPKRCKHDRKCDGKDKKCQCDHYKLECECEWVEEDDCRFYDYCECSKCHGQREWDHPMDHYSY